MRKRTKRRCFWMAALLLAMAAFAAVYCGLVPLILAQGEAVLSNRALSCLNSAIEETLSARRPDEQLIFVEKRGNSGVSMVQMDSMAVNEIAVGCAAAAKQKLAALGEIEVQIPLGNVLGSRLFSGQGPKIRVRVQQTATVKAGFHTEFEEAGINQTRYRIYVVLQADLRMFCGAGIKAVEVSSEVLVSEAIVVGEVPQTYANIPEVEEFANFIP